MKFIWEERAENAHHLIRIFGSSFIASSRSTASEHHGARVRTRRAVEVDYAAIDRVVRDKNRRDPQILRVRLGACSASYSSPGRRRIEKPQLAGTATDGCFEYYGGVSHVTVPDCLKNGVIKCHLYDPDLNEDYAYLARTSPRYRPGTVRNRRTGNLRGLVKYPDALFRFRSAALDLPRSHEINAR